MILKGNKVLLRPVQLADAKRFVKWFNDPQVNKFLFLRGITLAKEKKYILDKISGKEKDTVHFCIDTKAGLHIGAVSLESIQKRNKNASFGIMIGDKHYWSKGFGEEASKLIINYGFEKLKLH